MAGRGNFGEILNVLDESKKIHFYLEDEQTNLVPCYPLDDALNLEDAHGRTYFTVEYVYSSSLYYNALLR